MSTSTARNTMGGTRPRNADDAYYTPDALALAICRRLRETIGEVDLIIEPSAGGGAFVRAARETWRSAFIGAYDPNLTALGSAEADDHAALRWEEAPEWVFRGRDRRQLVLGNPPYNLPGDGRGGSPTTAERHVQIALDRLSTGGWLAFLLRLSFLGAEGRIERLYSEHPLHSLWPVYPRPSFTGDGKADGSEYGVFVWRKGYRGPVDLRPLRWER